RLERRLHFRSQAARRAGKPASIPQKPTKVPMSKRNKNIARRVTPPAPAVLPLGALAAGFGMMLVSGSALAQSGPVPTPPAPSASAPAEAVLPAVKVKAAAEESAKESLQTVKTTIGK